MRYLNQSLIPFSLPPQERLTSHGGIGLSSGSPAYSAHTGGHTGRNGPASGHSGSHGGSHGPGPTMHHQTLQSDFQPPYFPPPFHHTTQSPPQQQVGSTGEGSIIVVLSMYVNVYFICRSIAEPRSRLFKYGPVRAATVLATPCAPAPLQSAGRAETVTGAARATPISPRVRTAAARGKWSQHPASLPFTLESIIFLTSNQNIKLRPTQEPSQSYHSQVAAALSVSIEQ